MLLVVYCLVFGVRFAWLVVRLFAYWLTVVCCLLLACVISSCANCDVLFVGCCELFAG